MKLRMQIIYIKWYVEKFLKICKKDIFELHTKHTTYRVKVVLSQEAVTFFISFCDLFHGKYVAGQG